MGARNPYFKISSPNDSKYAGRWRNWWSSRLVFLSGWYYS